MGKGQTNATSVIMHPPGQFEDPFENTQWRKVKQMQPVQLCILLCKRFEDPFEDAQWEKVKQHRPTNKTTTKGILGVG